MKAMVVDEHELVMRLNQAKGGSRGIVVEPFPARN